MIRALILLMLPIVVLADVPKKPTLTRYRNLWNDSLFTSKPIPETGPARPEENPLEDYALGGISRLQDGYYAILINKKDPSDREVIKPGGDSGFTIVDVKWDESNWKQTVATVQSGSHRGSVGFDDKLMTPKTAAPQQAQQAQPGRPNIPGANQNNPQRPTGARTPRPRVVRPPTPPTNTNSNDNRGRGRGR